MKFAKHQRETSFCDFLSKSPTGVRPFFLPTLQVAPMSRGGFEMNLLFQGVGFSSLFWLIHDDGDDDDGDDDDDDGGDDADGDALGSFIMIVS